MEKGIFDYVVDELLERKDLVRAELAQRFKKTKPFRMEPVPEDEMLLRYDALTPEQMDELIATDGEEATGQMIQRMETLKQRRAR